MAHVNLLFAAMAEPGKGKMARRRGLDFGDQGALKTGQQGIAKAAE